MSPLTSSLAPETVAYLHELKRSGVVLGLDHMRAFVQRLGHPERSVPIIHVAGTNGKGSVAAMVEAILRRAGWKTGLYTSPHLVRLAERIQINRVPISAVEMADLVAELRKTVNEAVRDRGPAARPSYFEFMTALAFAHFARNACDIAVVEVGMGGRLDATNVVQPEVSVITSIALDHTEFLGNSIQAVAAEKAGIIKRDRPVVIGGLPRDAERIVRSAALAVGAPVHAVSETFGSDLAAYPTTNLTGDFQRVNAATATLVARQLDRRWRLDRTTIADALQTVDWPGRWQTLEIGGRRVILDASHNAEGATTLERNLRALMANGPAPVIAVGVLGSVRAKPLLEVACRFARELWLLVPQQSRACSHAELAAALPPTFAGPVVRGTLAELFPTPETTSSALPPDAPIVVTGSIYLAGEVLVRLDPSRGPLEPDLQDF